MKNCITINERKKSTSMQTEIPIIRNRKRENKTDNQDNFKIKETETRFNKCIEKTEKINKSNTNQFRFLNATLL